MCIGGSSASTDRKNTLTGYGELQDVFGTLKKFGGDLMTQGKNLSTSGKSLTDTGVGDTDKSLKYFSDIMSGDPSKVLAASAPEINGLVGQSDAARKSIVNNGNRSGGNNAELQDINQKTSGAILDTTNKARANAGSQVAQIGESKTRTGLQELSSGLGAESAGVSATEGAGSAASSLTSLSAQSRVASQKIHDDAVQQWADAISKILFSF